MTVGWRTFMFVLAVGAAVVPLPAGAIESVYSARLFPALQVVLTRGSNRVPFALLDLMLVGVTLWWIASIARDAARRGSIRTVAGRALLRAATLAAVLYVAFLLAWGLNYRRVPLDAKLAFDPTAVSTRAATAAANTAVDRLNELHAPAHAQGWPLPRAIDPALAAAAATAQREAGAARAAEPARPKPTLLDAYFRRAGVDGMTDPYFLETLVNDDLLPFERPFLVAHEWAHLAGFADEGEANFVGWLTCMRGPTPAQYSGWMFLYTELAAAVPRAERGALAQRLGPGPRADLQAIGNRLRRSVSPRVSRAGWLVYDRYLRANRVESGAASYQGVVRLALGTALGNGVIGRSPSPRVSPR